MIVFFNFLFPFTTKNLDIHVIHCVTLTHQLHASDVLATKCDQLGHRNSVFKTIQVARQEVPIRQVNTKFLKLNSDFKLKFFLNSFSFSINIVLLGLLECFYGFNNNNIIDHHIGYLKNQITAFLFEDVDIGAYNIIVRKGFSVLRKSL